MRKFILLIILMSNLIFISCVEEEILQEVTIEMKEDAVEANMYAVQAAVETLSVYLLGSYPTTKAGPGGIEDELPPDFRNPFDTTEPLANVLVITAGHPVFIQGGVNAVNEGRVEYAHDGTPGSDDAYTYTISGAGKDGRTLELILTPDR